MSDIQVSMQWDGKQLTITVNKPLTEDLYKGLKISPNSLAHLLLAQASNEVLFGGPHIEIKEMDNLTNPRNYPKGG